MATEEQKCLRSDPARPFDPEDILPLSKSLFPFIEKWPSGKASKMAKTIIGFLYICMCMRTHTRIYVHVYMYI